MRILFLNPIGALGGAERSLLDIFAALRALEPDWELRLIVGADGALLAEAAKLGVQCEVLPMPEELLVLGDSAQRGRLATFWRMLSGARKSLSYAKLLRARVNALRPSAIHSNGIKFHLLTRMMGRPSACAPVIWHIRDFIGARKLMRRALRWAAPAARLAIANSEATAADARTVLKNVPVRTVLNGIDVDYFSPGTGCPGLLDELAGLPAPQAPLDGILRVGLLASYARWKGQDLLLRAAAKVLGSPHCPAVRFYIVGGPIYKTQGSQFSLVELQAQARALNLPPSSVGFIPFQNQPLRIYRSLDIVVHASSQPEPFGRAIAEAMSCGRAVIATSAGGARELFIDGSDALGVPMGDETALAAALVRLLADEKLRQQLGAQARRTALARFSLQRLGRELRDIFVACQSGFARANPGAQGPENWDK